MLNSKRIGISLLLIVSILGFYGFALVSQPVYAQVAKSLYLIADHHTAQFDAWSIDPLDGTADYQATYWLSYADDPAGIAVDVELNPDGTVKSATLFVTSEFDRGVELVDAITMTSLGYVGWPLPDDLAGIDVDSENCIVYAVERWTDNLYAFDWNRATKTLTPISGFDPYDLPGCSGAFGIAIDEIADVLWVADAAAGVARAYSTITWTEDTSLSFTPSHMPVDIAVDRQRGFVYTVSMSAHAYTPPGTGSLLLSKYDLATGTETTGSLVDQGVGVAVDEATGFVYVTLSPYGRGLSQGDLQVWDTSTTPWTLVDSDKTSGSPAGICIPKEAVGYNPLGLGKTDTPDPVQCGGTITYTISFDNLLNNYPVTNVVLVDDLPPETSFVSASDGGTYDPTAHQVTWDIGTLPAGAPQQSVTLVVSVNSGTVPGTVITNVVTIDSSETGPSYASTKTTVMAPTVESCDSAGIKKDSFNPGETVYANGSGYCPSTTYDLYVVPDTTWTDGMAIPGAPISVFSDSSGNIPPTAVMSPPLTPGKYDIVVDVNGNGVYDAGVDALDDCDIQVTAGFLVIPEYLFGAILGLIGCFAAFGVFRLSKRKPL